MPNPNPMFLEKPFSLAHARRMFAGSDPVKLALLAPLLIHDYSFNGDEFQQALDTGLWTTAVSAGGGPTAFAYNAARTGRLEGATGTTDDDVTAIHLAETFLDPDDNPFFLIQWQVTAVTGFSFEIGLSDPKTSENLPGITDVDDPTIGNGVTDILAVHMDTDQTRTAASLVGDGTTGSAVATDLTLGGPGGSTDYTPTTSTWQTFVFGVRDNLGYVAIWDGDSFVGRFSTSNGPDGGVLVRPYALFRTRNTTNKIVNIRKAFWGCENNE